ncbi:MAG: hypothetical protein KDA58_15905, partial [Planctomycetaceae bacterium]|nr:hypothetical protein [Planctomycetaceae bacterium]
VPRIDALPRAKTPLLQLPDNCRVPLLSQFDGGASGCDLRMAWNPAGLAIAVAVTGKSKAPICHADDPDRSDSVRLWLDTRDTRTIHRASRFCHHFVLMPTGGGGGGDPCAVQLPVARAAEDAPEIDVDDLLLEATATKSGWSVSAWFPAATLHGYDPLGVGRLGFSLHVRDLQLGHMYYSVGEDFPISADPSLWASLVLTAED